MLLKGYRKEITRPECWREALALHCIARLHGLAKAIHEISGLEEYMGRFQLAH